MPALMIISQSRVISIKKISSKKDSLTMSVVRRLLSLIRTVIPHDIAMIRKVILQK